MRVYTGKKSDVNYRPPDDCTDDLHTMRRESISNCAGISRKTSLGRSTSPLDQIHIPTDDAAFDFATWVRHGHRFTLTARREKPSGVIRFIAMRSHGEIGNHLAISISRTLSLCRFVILHGRPSSSPDHRRGRERPSRALPV